MTSPTATIAHALKGIDFPCSRDSLLDYARRRAAPGETIDLLAAMPDRSYQSMAEVFRGLKEAGVPASALPPEPEDFYEEIQNPPPLALSAPEPHQDEVLMAPWWWWWNAALRWWELAWDWQKTWWRGSGLR